MLTKRIIPCLDVRDGKLTKGVKFQDNVDIGDPVDMARRYYEGGADEIVFYDITASHEGRGIMLKVVEKVAEQILFPFPWGRHFTVADMRDVLLAERKNFHQFRSRKDAEAHLPGARRPSAPNAS